MKYEKETTGPKNPNVIVKKSALEEFLEEWGSWRGKRKAKKESHRPTDDDIYGDNPDGWPSKKKNRKKNTHFMDSGFMLVIKFFVGTVEIIMSVVVWVFSFMFSFKGIAIIGALFYYFGNAEIVTKIIEGQVKEQAIEMKEEIKADLNELKEEHGEDVSDTFNTFKSSLEAFADSFEGLEINIKKTDGTVINIGGDDKEIDTHGTGPVMGWNSDMPATPLKPEVPNE